MLALFADDTLPPSWLGTALGILSGPISLFGAWVWWRWWKWWRAKRADAVEDRKLTAAEVKEKKDDDKREETRVVRQWRTLFEQENKLRAEAERDCEAESKELRAEVATERQERVNCQLRLTRLETLALANGWELPELVEGTHRE